MNDGIHLREPKQVTGRTPYADSTLHHLPAGPFVVVTIGDDHGDEIRIYAHSVTSLKRVVGALRLAIHQLRDQRGPDPTAAEYAEVDRIKQAEDRVRREDASG